MKFYPLQHEEWKVVTQNLKPCEIVILYHLRTLDPFGDRMMRLNVSELATELNLNRSTCSRALKKLCSDGYITLSLETVIVTVVKNPLTPSQECDQKSTSDDPTCGKPAAKVKGSLTSVIKKSHLGSKSHTSDQKVTPEDQKVTPEDQKVTPEDQKVTPEDQKVTVPPPESSLGDDSAPSHTIKTIKTDQIGDLDDLDLKAFIKTTIEKKGTKLKKPDQYVAKCLANDREQWESLFADSKKPSSSARNVLVDDIWYFEQVIGLAISAGDYAFARGRLSAYPHMAIKIFENRPEWEQLLCTN